MIGSVCPHSVIFPSIVGKNNAAYPEFVRSTYNLLVSSFDAELVAQTEFFIREIKRITILWEEEWLNTLNQLHGENYGKIMKFDSEMKKLVANQSLNSRETETVVQSEYAIILDPILSCLHSLADKTICAVAETSRYSYLIIKNELWGISQILKNQPREFR